MKKVLFIISSLGKGGAERALSNLTLHFPDEWQIDILLNSAKLVEYPYRGNILTLEMNETPKMDSILYHFRLLVKRIIRLRRLKKQNEYTACISFLDSANIANILSGKRKCKVIVSARSSLVRQSKLPQYKYVVNPLVKLFYNYADKIVAVSEGIKEELIKHYRLKEEKVIAIGNGYDISEITKKAAEIPDEKEIFLTNKVIITVGRLSEEKAQWHLIRAFKEVLKKEQQVKLFVLGIGPLERYLKQLTEELDLKEHVFFKGFVKNPYQYIARSQVFIMPSMYEGFPNALAEAVCLGVPCVATDFHTGAREILAPDIKVQEGMIEEITEAEYGILTPICSGIQYKGSEPLEYQEQCLAEAILLLLQNNEKNVEYVKKSYLRSETLGIDRTVQKWVEIIEQIDS